MCFWCSKEPSHRDGSFEYPQHMFWLRNKKKKFQIRTLIWGPVTLFFSGQIIKSYEISNLVFLKWYFFLNKCHLMHIFVGVLKAR